jgi:hypothetical protein
MMMVMMVMVIMVMMMDGYDGGDDDGDDAIGYGRTVLDDSKESIARHVDNRGEASRCFIVQRTCIEPKCRSTRPCYF